jgi:hypothetical protein
MVTELLALYRSPRIVIDRREAHKDDYVQARSLSSKGDKAGADRLRTGAAAFVALSTQLMDELPRFLSSAAKYFDAIVVKLAMVQRDWFEKSGAAVSLFVEEYCSLLGDEGPNGDVVRAWWTNHRPMFELLEGLKCVSDGKAVSLSAYPAPFLLSMLTLPGFKLK